MSAMMWEAAIPLLQRLWIYQGERFPLAKTALLLGVFASAGINLSAQLSNRALPSWPSYVVAILVSVIFFFQLRACDEIKDAEDDRLYRPERPVPRGLVSLRLVVGLGLAGIPVSVLAAGLLDMRLLPLLTVVWIWMALMAVEFFVPAWLKARPFLYLVSHMLILPLIALFATACEWLRFGGHPSPALFLFLFLSFACGCVFEVGRKIYAPINERTGVETYSALLGARDATLLWCASLIVAYGLLIAIGSVAGVPRPIAVIGLIGLAACLSSAAFFLRGFDAAGQRRIDTMSALWLLISYGACALAPFAPWWG